MAIARMRTVKAVVEYCKNEDPETMVNEYMLRRLIKQGTIPVVYAGTKALINIDRFMEYLNCEIEQVEDKSNYVTRSIVSE